MRTAVFAAWGCLMLTGSAYAKSDASFIKDAIRGDNSEIKLGALAEHEGASPGVRDLGKMLQADHAKAREKAVAVASAESVTPPDGMSAEAKIEYAKLKLLSGNAFDAEFARYMVSDHKDDISEFEKQAAQGDPQTSALATATLPDLKKHLAAAQALSGS